MDFELSEVRLFGRIIGSNNLGEPSDILKIKRNLGSVCLTF